LISSCLHHIPSNPKLLAIEKTHKTYESFGEALITGKLVHYHVALNSHNRLEIE